MANCEIACFDAPGEGNMVLFRRQCPTCKRFLQFPKRFRIRFAPDEFAGYRYESCQRVRCSKCGYVKPEFESWWP